MGENVLLGQVKDFKKSRDQALQKMAAPTLFDRPDVISTNFTASPINGSRLQTGVMLSGYVSADGNCVYLAQGHQKVGTISGDGAKALIEGIEQTQGLGFASMKVIEISPISGFFKVRVDDTKEVK